jgi:DNA-directed RNA polymerase subunit RPC12/RpoP
VLGKVASDWKNPDLLLKVSTQTRLQSYRVISSPRCNHRIWLKSATPIRMMAGVPIVPQPSHGTIALALDDASAQAP